MNVVTDPPLPPILYTMTAVRPLTHPAEPGAINVHVHAPKLPTHDGLSPTSNGAGLYTCVMFAPCVIVYCVSPVTLTTSPHTKSCACAHIPIDAVGVTDFVFDGDADNDGDTDALVEGDGVTDGGPIP